MIIWRPSSLFFDDHYVFSVMKKDTRCRMSVYETSTKLSLSERLEMSILLERSIQREIAKALDRSPNTISAEIRRNSTNGVYEPKKAQAKARVKLRYRRFQWRRLDHDTLLKKRVVRGSLTTGTPMRLPVG